MAAVVVVALFLMPASGSHAAGSPTGPTPPVAGGALTSPPVAEVPAASATRADSVRPLDDQQGQVSASINLLTGTVEHGPVAFSTGDGPVSIAADPLDGSVYVVDQQSGNVAVLNATTGVLERWIPVGYWPTSIAYDSNSESLYITKPLSLSIAVINETGTAVAGTIPYLDTPSSVTIDETTNATGSLVVTGHGTNTVLWIGDENFSTFWSTGSYVPDPPNLDAPWQAIAVEPSIWPSAQILVANEATHSLAEFCHWHEGTQYFWGACAYPSVGSDPVSLAYDGLNQRVYVTNSGSNNVSVLAATVTGTTVTEPVWRSTGSIHVGTVPIAIAVDPDSGNLFVVNQGSDNVTVIDGSTDHVIGSVPVGSDPDAITYDSANGNMYVANYASDNVSVFSAVQFESLLDRATIRTAYRPLSIANDVANGEQYIFSGDSSGVLQLNGSSGMVAGSGILTGWTNAGPGGVVYDPVNHWVYVTQSTASGVLALNGSESVLIPNTGGGAAIAFNPLLGGVVAVVNLTSGGVLLLNGSTSPGLAGSGTLKLGNFSLPGAPDAIAFDLATGGIYVASEVANDVSVISWTPASGGQILGSVAVGARPDAIAYDPVNGDMYVANRLTNNISVLGPVPGNPVGRVVGTIPVGSAPDALAYDASNGYLYVADSGSNELSVVNTSTDTVAGTVPVGVEPSAISVDERSSELYVTDAGDSAVTVVSTRTYPVTFVESGLPMGTSWSALLGTTTKTVGGASLQFLGTNGTFSFAVPPLSIGPGQVWAASPEGGNVSVSGGPAAVDITFTEARGASLLLKETGLGIGADWSASVDGAAQSNTTVAVRAGSPAASGKLSFEEAIGPVQFAITAPRGYGVVSVLGRGNPSQTHGSVAGPTTWTVRFGALRAVEFSVSPNLKFEPYLPFNWTVTVQPDLRSGPPTQTVTTNGSFIDVFLPEGAGISYNFSHADDGYRLIPSSGHLRVGTAAALTKYVKFELATRVLVTFTESGLQPPTTWYLTLTGGPSGVFSYPYTFTWTPPTFGPHTLHAKLKIYLAAGTYKWIAFSYAADHDVHGTLVVGPPGPVTVPVVFTEG